MAKDNLDNLEVTVDTTEWRKLTDDIKGVWDAHLCGCGTGKTDQTPYLNWEGVQYTKNEMTITYGFNLGTTKEFIKKEMKAMVGVTPSLQWRVVSH